MKLPFRIHRNHYSLSTKICLISLPFVIGVFVYALGDFFFQSRRILRQEAVERAHCKLENTVSCVTNYMMEVETLSRNMKWQLQEDQAPDSLEAFSRRALQNNPDTHIPREKTESALTEMGLDLRIRGEALTLEQFAAFTDHI